MASEPIDFVIDNLDPKVVNQEVWNRLNEIVSYTHRLLNYRYHLLLWRLIKSGSVSLADLIKATGYPKQRLYKIVDAFDKKQEARQSNET